MEPPRDAAEPAPTDETASGDQSTPDVSSSWVRLAPFVPAAALVVAAAWIGRRLWFFSDDWNILAGYHSGHLTEAFNGHLSLVPAGVYQILFHTVGVGSYTSYRVAGLLSLAILGFQVARWTMSWVGPALAALAVAAVMWNSSGASNVMFPFLMNFSLPIAALIAIWWHLDRLRVTHDRSAGTVVPSRLRVDLMAIALWLTLALATSGLGVMTAAAVAVELLLRRAPLRQWIAWAIPMALWILWWLGHRGANDISTDMAAVVPYALRMLLAGATSIAAGWRPLGMLLGIALAAGVTVVTIRYRRLDPRVAGALCAALAFSALTSLTRQDTVVPIPPDELRYGWTIGAYLVLAAVALVGATRERSGFDGHPDEGGGEASPAAGPSTALSSVAIPTVALVIMAVIVAAGALRLTGGMRDWADQVAGAAPGLRSNIYATEALGSSRMPSDAVIGPLSYVPVSAQDYLDAVADVGSPLAGAGRSDIGGRPEQRVEADKLLFSNLDIGDPVPAPAERPLEAEKGCLTDLEAPPGTRVKVLASSDADQRMPLTLGRFGEPGFLLDVPVGVSAISIPGDAPVGTTAVIPYRIVAPPGVLICPIEDA